MRQKKIVIRTKTKKNMPAKRATALSIADKMEKDFKEMPAKLIAQFKNEIDALKKQEAKLKTELNKAENQHKIIKKKHDILANAKSKVTAASKKRTVVAKKAFDLATNGVKVLTTKMDQVKNAWKTIAKKQTTFVNLNNALKKLEKELTKQAATPKTTKTKPKKVTVNTTTTFEPVIQTSDQIDTVTSNDTVEMN